MTKIPYATGTWNPVTGCTKISPGCKNCYAEKFAKRLNANPNPKVNGKYAHGFEPTMQFSELAALGNIKKPGRFLVPSMGDLFHENIDFTFVEAVFRRMIHAKHHVFLVLTKRPIAMRLFIKQFMPSFSTVENIWLGVSCENNKTTLERLPVLLDIDCKHRWISAEPLLEDTTLALHGLINKREIHWIVAGGESGSGARELKHCILLDMHYYIKNYYQIPFYLKQWGSKSDVPTTIKKETSNYREIPSDALLPSELTKTNIII